MSSDGSFGRVPLKLGPYGGTGGDTWDDGVYSTVKTIHIVHDATAVYGIKTQYMSAGDSIWSVSHGPKRADCDASISSVRLNNPDEYLIGIFGSLSSDRFTRTYIASITFKSNKSEYGPFGLTNPNVEKNFAIHVPGYKIVGLQGRCDKLFWFRAIGAYLQPIDHHQVPPTKSTYINVSSNEISGAVGNKNGNFSVANKYKVVNNIYGNASAQNITYHHPVPPESKPQQPHSDQTTLEEDDINLPSKEIFDLMYQIEGKEIYDLIVRSCERSNLV